MHLGNKLCLLRHAVLKHWWSQNASEMNATASPVVSPQESVGARLRNFLIGSVFALVLLVPKVLRLRHNAQTWLVFRILLAVAGASLVIVPLSFATGWLGAILGLAMFLAAILLPPAKPDNRAAEKAKELGALVIVNGGHYESMMGTPVSVQLFVAPETVFVLDSALHAVSQIPIAEISSVNAAEARERWILRVRWTEHTADFAYDGIFAEHLAHVAESTIRSVVRAPLPVLQHRAAGA
jgi:hypothetical protein